MRTMLRLPVAVRLSLHGVIALIFLTSMQLYLVRRASVESDTDTTTRYEESYRVTTKFSGNKALPGVHVHTLVTDLQNGRDESDVYLVVDSTNGTILKLDLPLSEESRLAKIAGSGMPGHKDGQAELAQFRHPKSAVVDDEGTIYVADTGNAAIRTISGGSVKTIAGGGSTGFQDGVADDARFSADIELYLDRTTCSLIVADRGNNAIRSIPLDQRRCKGPWSGSHEHPSSSLLSDKRFFFGIVSGMVVTDILLCLIPYSWVLQEWFVRAWQAVSDWHVVTVVITTIGIWFRFLLGRFWQRAAPDQSPLLSKAGV